MSGTASIGVGGEVGYGGYMPPFTAVQRQELEHQAMIYKYLVAGLPIPPDLVMPIRRSFEALSARLFNHPSFGGYSYYGKKIDPEPGRCRRTDGKKWRCSKESHPDSKYCERHMHRGRNRSRKHVESQSNSQISCSSNTGSFQGSESGSFRNVPLYSSEKSSFGIDLTKLQMDTISYGIDNKKFRYIPGMNPDSDERSFSSEAFGSVGNLGLGSGTGSSIWRSQVSSNYSLKQKPNDTQFLSQSSAQQTTGRAVLPFFSEWPTTKDSWTNLDDDDDDGLGKNVNSSTQLSISIPRASYFSSSSYAPNDG